jgi:hypothetical protein
VTVLPSIASLKALRGSDRTAPVRKPLIGFGDPVFRPDQLGRPLIAARALAIGTSPMPRAGSRFPAGLRGDGIAKASI